jgi:predicted nucleic acid-binding protein
VTRFVVDALVVLELAAGRTAVAPRHSLVAPTLVRSQALELLYAEVRAGTRQEPEARALLDRVATLRIRLLDDRVSRATAWRLAVQLDLENPLPAEYLAVTKLQADALVTLDPTLSRIARGVVPLEPLETLTS